MTSNLTIACTLASCLLGVAVHAQPSARDLRSAHTDPAPAGSFTDAQLRAEYIRVGEMWSETHRGEFEYDVRHILVVTRAQADAALHRIRNGEPFEQVAKAVSIDEGSSGKGGELGWNLSAHFVDQFSAAMRKLGPAGLVEAPVQSQFGWHIIEVRDMRSPTMPPFEASRAQLERRLRAANGR
ncbi:peptidylprolyl isomerase [Variovorax guangxiensis]|uniref:peptidylprolyl isomerase n=1 Tax=Variovorax guangxiensis TaxID=1775474 RepID=UPI00285AB797|nr:peptidylprolyl isomerase [Variovorax guangxiensis]MDR6860523.1 parvulin-like peptidyl-prolyl isomerase [Variovorax guangxiensis]